MPQILRLELLAHRGVLWWGGRYSKLKFDLEAAGQMFLRQAEQLFLSALFFISAFSLLFIPALQKGFPSSLSVCG